MPFEFAMSFAMRCILFVLALALSGCASQTPRSSSTAASVTAKESAVTIVYQSNRYGWLEPCGCHAKPFGGLDRESNAIAEARATRPVLYLDAGNMLARYEANKPLTEVRRKRLVGRAERLAGALDTLALDAMCPGPGDLTLGLPELRSIALRSKFAWISSNLLTRAGAPVFSPYVVIERGGIRYAILGLTDKLPESISQREDVVTASATDALNRWLPEALSRADVVVLLSQLQAGENEKLAASYPTVRVIVGGDKEVAFDPPIWLNGGQTLLVDTENHGFILGRLDLDFKVPFVSFYSPELAKSNQERLQRLEADNKATPSEITTDMIQTIRANDPLDIAVPGATKFNGELIGLSVERYGKPNAMTKWLKDEKKRIGNEGRASAGK